MNQPMPAETPPTLGELDQGLEECLGADRRVFRKRLTGLQRRARQGKPVDRGARKLHQDMARSRARRQARLDRLPIPTFPDELPVNEHHEELASAIRDHQVVIVCGETGSGKSTQLPKLCLTLGRGVDGSIGHTQPRRIAARTLAERVAEELGTEVGEGVGYKVRFTDRVRETTHLKLVTDGMLLAEIQSDPLLDAYDTLIVDEAHERSLNIDFLLGCLKQILPKRPDLKVIITSATIDPERFSRHFDDAPIIEVSGRTYPVDVRYRPIAGEDDDTRERDQQTAIVEAVDELARAGPGDILVFLSGEREIRDTAEALRKQHPPGTEILPLFARLSAAEQQRAFRPHAGRRIVLATNVAETSVTVPGIRYVVDTGRVRLSRYSHRTKIQRLPVEPISQASADQRAGRCGREAPGICIRLYSEEDYLSRPRFTDPEILRANLAAVILQMRWLGLGEVEAFPFVEPPDPRVFRDGYRLLHELGAVDDAQRLTGLGQQLARIPVDPTIGRMLLAAEREGALDEVLIIAAALNIQDPRERPMEARQAANAAHAAWNDPHSDFIALLNLWRDYEAQMRHLSRNKLRTWCREHFISHLRMREWSDVRRQLREQVKGMGHRVNQEPAEAVSIHRALLTGLLSRIALRTEEQTYTGPRNLKLLIFPGSGVARKRPRWIMAAEIVETSRVFARTVAAVDPRDVERAAGHLVHRTYAEPAWNRRKGRVDAFETVTLYGLPLVTGRRVNYARVDPAEARRIFLREGLAQDQVASHGAFLEHNRNRIAEIEALEAKARRRDLLVDREALAAFYDARVPAHVHDLKSFERWREEAEQQDPKLLFLSRDDLLQRDPDASTADDFPDSLEVAGIELPLEYNFEPGQVEDGVIVNVPLAALNQLRPEPFEWLVPGLLEEKVTTLIRGLPKSLRRNFVPAPDFAREALDALGTQRDRSLLDGLRRELLRMTGVDVPPEQWEAVSLPAHLRMGFRVLGEEGETLAEGQDLLALQAQFGDQAQAQFAASRPESEWERDGVSRWDFGDLPERVAFPQHGVTVHGYPAVEDRRTAVALRVLDSPEQARQVSQAGIRRLFMLELGDPFRYLRDNIPDLQTMALAYRGLGGTDALRDELLSALVDRLFLADGLPATEAEFRARLEAGRARVVEEGERFFRRMHRVLERYQSVRRALKEPRGLAGMESFRDMAEHLENLVYPGFMTDLPAELLEHLSRYLEGLEHRLTKQAEDPDRDAKRTRQVRPHWEQYLKRRAAHREQGIDDPALERYRHMLEEFRVSLFAQHLGTTMAASEKRLRALWSEVR